MTPRLSPSLALWLVLAFSVGSPVPCLADTPVTLRGDTDIRTGVVKLSDLFTGVQDSDDRDIAQAPPPGKQALYDSNLLVKLAQKYHIEWHAQSVNDHVLLSSPCTRITTEAIHAALVQKIRDYGVKGDVDISFDSHLGEIDLPASQSAGFTIDNFDFDTLSRRFHAQLVTDGSGGAYAMPLAGRASVKLHVPVLARKVEGGMIVSLADIEWADVPEDRVGDAVVTDAASLIGHELRRTTAAGDLLHTNDVMPPRLVRRGSLVSMKIETANMVITVQGKSLQDGAQGETVRVVNTQSNRMVEGIVDAQGYVVVNTAQKLAAIQ